MFLTVFLITAAATTALLSTEVGRNAVIDQQVASRESFGRPMTQAELDQVEKIAPYFVYITPAFQILGLSVGGLVIAGLAFAVFNAMLGGDATFKQIFAIVCHSGVVLACTSLFTTPLAYARESLSGATNLAVFLPFLDESVVSRAAARFDRSDLHLVDAQPRHRPGRPLPQAYRADRHHHVRRLRGDRA